MRKSFLKVVKDCLSDSRKILVSAYILVLHLKHWFACLMMGMVIWIGGVASISVLRYPYPYHSDYL